MPNRSNRTWLLLMLALVLGGEGCRSNIRRAQPLDIAFSGEPTQKIEVSARDRAHFETAVSALEAERVEEAEARFLELVERSPHIPGAHLNLALIHHHRGEYAAARTRVAEVLRLAPRNAIAHNLDGRLNRREGHFKAAEIAYARALAIDPDYAIAHFNLAVLYDLYLQYWIDARRHYQRYRELTGDSDPKIEAWIRDLDMRIRDAGG